MDKVTHNGKSYEIGKYYLFSDDGVDWEGYKLKGLCSKGGYVFKAQSCDWKMIKPIPQEDVGGVEVALVEGAYYKFMCDKNEYVGVYGESLGAFVVRPFGGDCRRVNQRTCTDIVRMVPEGE